METKQNIAKKQVENIMNQMNNLIADATHQNFPENMPHTYEVRHLREKIILDYLAMSKNLAFEEDESQDSFFSSLICATLANHIGFPKTVLELRREISCELMNEASNEVERREAVRIGQSFVPSEEIDIESCLDIVSKRHRVKICIYDADNLLQIVRDRPLIINTANIRFKRDVIICYKRSSNQFVPLVKPDKINLVQQWKDSHFNSDKTLELDAIRVDENKRQEGALHANEEKSIQKSHLDSHALPPIREDDTELGHSKSSMLHSQCECKKSSKDKSSTKPTEASYLKWLLHPLSTEEKNEVDRILYSAGSQDEIIATLEISDIRHETVTRKSAETLRPGVWLNDEIIHFYLMALQSRDEEINPENRSHIFESFFMTKLLDDGKGYDYHEVKRWSRKVPGKDVFALNKILFPINIDNQHWTLACVFMKERIIQYFDSMGGNGLDKFLIYLLQYLHDEWHDKKKEKRDDWNEWKLIGHTTDIPLQQNGKNNRFCYDNLMMANMIY